VFHSINNSTDRHSSLTKTITTITATTTATTTTTYGQAMKLTQ
jgi:hypothetical protein